MVNKVDGIPPLYVSKPLLPDIESVTKYIAEIWGRGIVTNNGPICQDLENRLSAFLDVPTSKLFNNGTIALLAAIKLFDLPIGSEVITTPLTFAATAHAIAWNNLRPVFVDIREEDLTIDPDSIIRAITPNTSAIIGVHVYGCICDHESLNDIAKTYGLKLIYDAAHAFGSLLNGESVAKLGDASVFSFHATKLYNTIEGGLLATPFPEDNDKIYFLRNFGIKNEDEVVSVGINGKMNELQAAIGLLNLDLFEREKLARSILRDRYREMLSGLNGIRIQEVGSNVQQSEQYFLLRINQNEFGRSRDEIKLELEKYNIYCRKYFYPLCTEYEPYKNCNIITHRKHTYADVARNEVLCLPFHSGVSDLHIDIMSDVFRRKHESIIGSENLGKKFFSVNRASLDAEVNNALIVIQEILECSDSQFKSRDFILEKLLCYGIPKMDSDIFQAYSKSFKAGGFGAVQFPTEFVDFLMMAVELDIKTVAEVGSYRGGSSYFMAAVLQRARKDFTLTMIDVCDNLIQFNKFSEILNLDKHIPSTSNSFNGKSFDLVFIDGAHDYASVMLDYENLGKYAIKAVAFHDIHGHEFDSLDGGTVKAWGDIKEKLRNTYKIIEYAHSSERSLGIGVAIRSSIAFSKNNITPPD